MGGREAVRGFGIQTLICLLDALKQNADWVAVTIEPDTDHDKVDILWELNGKKRRAVQVKSSQNPIGRGSIEGWCAELKQEVADEYELRLAGPLKTGALSGNFAGVEVPTPTSILLSDLSDQAVTMLDRYLENQNIHPMPASIRTALVDICAARLIAGAATGTRLTRQAFDGWMLHWITTAYPEALAIRLSANCDVLWSSLLIGSPVRPSAAFELTAPLGFYNSGRGAAIVEWIILLVRIGERRMIYGSAWFETDKKRAIFSEFAVGPGLAIERRVVFRVIVREGFASDAWPTGSHEITLRVKFAKEETPREIKRTQVEITGDHMSLLNKQDAYETSLSSMESYIFAL